MALFGNATQLNLATALNAHSAGSRLERNRPESTEGAPEGRATRSGKGLMPMLENIEDLSDASEGVNPVVQSGCGVARQQARRLDLLEAAP